jgi:hypothetical protein
MARQSSIFDRAMELGRQQQIELMQAQDQQRPYYHQPCNISPVLSTVGLTNNHRQIELDITPLNKFVKNMFPFVIDVSFLKVIESTYTDGRRTLENPQIKLIVSPAHRAELYSEDIEDKVKNHIRKKLIPLLKTMYEISTGFGLEIYFGSERSETILEHLKDE